MLMPGLNAMPLPSCIVFLVAARVLTTAVLIGFYHVSSKCRQFLALERELHAANL